MRKEALEVSVESLKSDYESQLQSQTKVMDSLHSELSILKNQNEDKQGEASEVVEQTQKIKIEITENDKTVREMKQEIQTMVAHD